MCVEVFPLGYLDRLRHRQVKIINFHSNLLNSKHEQRLFSIQFLVLDIPPKGTNTIFSAKSSAGSCFQSLQLNILA